MTAFSSTGLSVPCRRCGARPGNRCMSRSGRELKATHDCRWRDELAADPVRRWFGERTAWRSA